VVGVKTKLLPFNEADPFAGCDLMVTFCKVPFTTSLLRGVIVTGVFCGVVALSSVAIGNGAGAGTMTVTVAVFDVPLLVVKQYVNVVVPENPVVGVNTKLLPLNTAVPLADCVLMVTLCNVPFTTSLLRGLIVTGVFCGVVVLSLFAIGNGAGQLTVTLTVAIDDKLLLFNIL
jgi:hypothetical protein